LLQSRAVVAFSGSVEWLVERQDRREFEQIWLCQLLCVHDDSLLQLVSQRNPIFQNQGLSMINRALWLVRMWTKQFCNHLTGDQSPVDSRSLWLEDMSSKQNQAAFHFANWFLLLSHFIYSICLWYLHWHSCRNGQ
jgi:hypothetical protein